MSFPKLHILPLLLQLLWREFASNMKLDNIGCQSSTQDINHERIQGTSIRTFELE